MMKPRFLLLLALGSLLIAWQGGLALLGLDDASAKSGAQAVIAERLGMETLDTYVIAQGSRAVRKAFLALNPEQRTSATQALGAAVKTLVLSAPFRAAWEAEVKRRGGANHGLNLTAMEKPPASPAQAMDSVKKAMLESRVKDAEQFAKNKPMPAATLKMLIDMDKSMVGPADSMMVASPAAQKAAMAKYAEAEKLLASDPVAAQKALLDAKLLAAGLAAGGAGVEQASAKSGQMNDAQQKRREQETWNKLQLGPLVRKELQRFVQIAGTVDFAAATQPKGKELVFVNPVHEKKPLDWKLLYRAGKGPTMAAVAIAQQVLAELK